MVALAPETEELLRLRAIGEYTLRFGQIESVENQGPERVFENVGMNLYGDGYTSMSGPRIYRHLRKPSVFWRIRKGNQPGTEVALSWVE